MGRVTGVIGRASQRISRQAPGVILVVGAALAMTAAVGIVVAVRVIMSTAGTVPNGTSIAGVPVGGLTTAQARRAVHANLPPPSAVLELALAGEPGFPLRVPVTELAPAPRVDRAVRRAMRTPSLGARIRRELGIGGRRDIPVTYRLRPGGARRLIARIARMVDRRPRDASVMMRGGAPVIRPGHAGRRVVRSELAQRLRILPSRAFVPVVPVPPRRDDADAQRAIAQARLIADRPVTVVGSGRSARLERSLLTRAIRFVAERDAIRSRLDAQVLGAALRPVFGRLNRPPRSARFRVRGRSVRVIPARAGRRLDAAGVARRIEARPEAVRVQLRVRAVEPARTTDDARRLRIRERISSSTTPYTCCQPRVTNIVRAAEVLDGQIIPAGGRFSLNEALGERTVARGFVPAPQINAGRLEDAVGGGVSQMATTVFNAAFFAGLQVVTHTPHEFWIARYPPGREATVSWGGPELIVRNDWPAAVLLRVFARRTSLTVQMYSTRLRRRVETSTVGSPVEGSAFPIAYTRRVLVGERVRRDERYTWSYRSPPKA